MVSVLATGPEVHVFKPSRGDGFLRTKKFCSTPSVGGEESRRPYVVRCYSMKKNLQVWIELLRKAKFPFLSLIPPDWYQMTLMVSFSALAKKWRDFSRRYHSTMALHAHMAPGVWTIGPLVAVVQRRSVTLQTWSLRSTVYFAFTSFV
jgi:hypothetical protein